jgi:hypothetical protein
MNNSEQQLNEPRQPGLHKASVSSSHGYIQKGNRYFWRIGAKTKFYQGFKSKDDCDKWINEVRDKYGFDWRVGFIVKFKKFDEPWTLVTRKGDEVKCW